MNEDISRSVLEVCESLGLEVRSYSGRCMYGRSCIGVSCGRNTHQIVAQIVIGLCELGADGIETADHLTRDGAIASDSMGLGSIVYFPRLPWVEVDSLTDGEDDENVPLNVEPDSSSLEA